MGPLSLLAMPGTACRSDWYSKSIHKVKMLCGLMCKAEKEALT